LPRTACHAENLLRVKHGQSWLRNNSDLGTIHKENEEEEEEKEKEKTERRTRRRR
jgi:hypothetical protein